MEDVKNVLPSKLGLFLKFLVLIGTLLMSYCKQKNNTTMIQHRRVLKLNGLLSIKPLTLK